MEPLRASIYAARRFRESIGVAAEAFAAAQFARNGINVSVQYGANQPEYDLMVSKDDQILKVSVKGSQDGRNSSERVSCMGRKSHSSGDDR